MFHPPPPSFAPSNFKPDIIYSFEATTPVDRNVMVRAWSGGWRSSLTNEVFCLCGGKGGRGGEGWSARNPDSRFSDVGNDVSTSPLTDGTIVPSHQIQTRSGLVDREQRWKGNINAATATSSTQGRTGPKSGGDRARERRRDLRD
jgi:hypothetical protein